MRRLPRLWLRFRKVSGQRLRRALRTLLLVAAGIGIGPTLGIGAGVGAVQADVRTVNPDLDGALALLDRWLDAHRAYTAIPAISVGIVHDQALIWQKSYGLANPKRGIRATAETLYSICSISKVFAGISIMQQRDAGALDLDDPVAEHLPAFRVRQSAQHAGPLTVRSLLTHSAGLPRESIGAYWSPPDFEFPKREDLLKTLARQRTLYAPDTRFKYSNLGIALAGEIVAMHSGDDYEAYLEERILNPLEMSETRLEFPKRPRDSVMAVGFGARDRSGNRPEMPSFDTAGIAAAAGMTSSVVDLARFAAWNFRTLAGKANPVLDPASLRDMQRVHWVDPDWNTTWGLAFEVRKTGSDTLVGHEGSCPGFNSAFALFPKHQLGVIVLTNSSGINTNVVVENVQKLLVPALAKSTDRTPTGKGIADAAAQQQLGPYTGRYDAQPWSGEVVIVQHGDELRVAWLPSDDISAGLIHLRQLKDDVFFTVRDEVEVREDRWTFLRDDEGRVIALTNHALRLKRVP